MASDDSPPPLIGRRFRGPCGHTHEVVVGQFAVCLEGV